MDKTYIYSDKELFDLISGGDEDAFEALFHRFLAKLTAFAFRLTDDQESAREIVQDTFLHLWLGRDKLENVDNPGGWIFTITSRQCYKFLRRKFLNESRPVTVHPEQAPEDLLGLEELRALIREAIDSLSDQRRKIYLLSRDEELTIPEIAGQLNLSSNTVKNTLVTALKQIREFLEYRGYILPGILLLLSCDYIG